MKIHNKLVRNKIPEIIEEKGTKCNYHIANDEEFLGRLYEKIQEELGEFKREPNIEEYIDIIEVLETLANFHGIDLKPMRLKKRMKREHRGGFDKRIVLDSTGI